MPAKVECSRKRRGSREAREHEKVRREIVAKALLDEGFRARLLEKPESVLRVRLTAEDRKSLERLAASLPQLEAQLAHLASTILCITNDF